MRETLSFAWQRFSLIQSVNSDAIVRFIATLFYFTVMAPFGIGSTLLIDPLRRKQTKAEWIDREPVSNDLESAKQQG